MKKAIAGVTALAALAAMVALGPVVKRRMVQKMRDHCKQMMAQFARDSEMAGQEAMDPEAMRHETHEHCEQMAAQHEERTEPVATT